MPTVASGLIAVVKGPIVYTETDADGKAVATHTFAKGDIVHDEAMVQALHGRHFHHALSVTAHSEHLCPEDCAKVAKPAPKPVPSLPAATTAASVFAAQSEVK